MRGGAGGGGFFGSGGTLNTNDSDYIATGGSGGGGFFTNGGQSESQLGSAGGAGGVLIMYFKED